VLVHDKLGTIIRFVVRDATHLTYTDSSWFARVTSQVANIGVAYLVYMFSASFFASLDWSFWSTIAAQAAAVYFSYALVGRFLKFAGNWAIGSVLALVAAVGAGMIAWGLLPFTFWWTAAASAGIGLLAGSFTFAYGYAVPYATLQKLMVYIDTHAFAFGTNFVEPFFTGAHDLFWQPIAGLARFYLRTYRAVRDTLRPYFGNFGALWADAWKSVKEVWEQMTARK
jgi:hypothetical protein